MGSYVPYCTKLTETVFFILKMLFCLQLGYSIYVDRTGFAQRCFSFNYWYWVHSDLVTCRVGEESLGYAC